MKEFMDSFNGILGSINDVMYTYVLIFALIIVGLYLTIRTRFVQVRLFPRGIRSVMEKGEEGKTSSFQALMVATASRVGTGNIAGVTTAIVLGGYGAAFWMWIMAIIGSASAFVESTLAQIYKQKDGNNFKGGPAFYIEKALKARWLGMIFATLLIITFGFGFNGLQSYTLTSAFSNYISNFEAGMAPIIIGIILAIISAYFFFSGPNRISKISSIVVPIMAGLYIFVAIIVLVMNIDKVPSAFSLMIDSAFDFKAIFGGFAGSCLVYGIKRGLFSNEAGMGSAPNAAASAHVSHPVKQGLAQVVSVFIDTILVCTSTMFIAMLAGTPGLKDEAGELVNGIPFLQNALEGQFGRMGVHFITISIVLFAFTSIIGNFYYVQSNIKYISTNKIFGLVITLLCVAMVFVGANVDLEFAWNLADVTMGAMALVNIIAMFLLGKYAFRALEDYETQLRAGREPVFLAKNIGIDNADFWNEGDEI